MEYRMSIWRKMPVLFFFTFVCNLLLLRTDAYGAQETDTWAIPNGSENKYQKNVEVTEDKIIQEGTHNAATTGIKYRTMGYYMTLSSYETDGDFNIDKKAFIKVHTKSDTIGGKKVVTYTIKKQDFINAMMELGVTSSTLNEDNKGYISVYLHNVFEIYNGSTGIAYKDYTNILGYQEMLKKGKKITGGEGWNNTGDNPTVEILKSYYNFEYQVYPTIFSVEIVAVDDKGNELGVLKSGDKGMFMEKYPGNGPYTAPETYIKSNIAYKAKGEWYCIYTDRSTGKIIKRNKMTGRTISNYSLPDGNKDFTVKLCMVYENKPEIVIHAADFDTGDIIKENLYTGLVTANEFFTQKVDAIISLNGISYKKTAKYTYEYENNEGIFKTVLEYGSTVLGSLEFRVPNNVKATSVIVVKAYYRQMAGDIPVTVIAVDDKTGTKIQVLATGSVKGEAHYSYDVPDSENISEGHKEYHLTGRWDWRYTPKSSTYPTVNAGIGKPVSFTAPEADKVKNGIEVYVYYSEDTKTATDKINLQVNMVSENGRLIDRISEETVTREQAISKTAQATKSINKIVYTYQNRWECEYFTPEGARTISGTGNPAAFKIPSETNLGTVVRLNLYYEVKQAVEVPEEADPIRLSLDSPSPYGVINGDKYGSPYFISELGIPTTESQYVYVKTKDYLLGYELVNRTGKVTFRVPVTMRYTLQYWTATPEWAGGPKPVTDIVEDKQYIYVERAYSYWEIAHIELYCVSTARVYNYSLPGGGVTLTANNSYLNLPSLVTWHSSDVKDHVFPPIQANVGITINASEPITSDTSSRPRIEYEDLTSYAVKMCGEAIVKNDLLIFNGGTVLTNETAEKITRAPDTSYLRQSNTIIPDKALYTDGQIVEATKSNGSYPSNGNVSYVLHPSSISTSYKNMLYNIPVNDVIIHTPVICDPVITEDNAKWSQVVNPIEDAVQIVLDPDSTLNDFTVRISNTLQHSIRPGYYTRDFSRSLINPEYTSYLAREDGIVRNEMKLPIDVYLDTYADHKTENDKFIKAGTWIVLGRETYRFYVPMWVREGTYTVQFRTVAVNGADKLDRTETTRNASRNNYVAISSRRFQVSGRIYGLTIYDVSDYPKWENVFRMGSTMLFKYFEGAIDGTLRQGFNKDYAYYYTVGTRDQYGKETGRLSKYTLPMINGNHPKYKNLGVLKTGYAIRFRLDTTGEMYDGGCMVKIVPTFYYVDAEGKNRQRVDLYYNEEIYGKHRRVVKVGDALDLVNIKQATTGNLYNRIPERELRNTAAVMNTDYSRWIEQRSVLYSYNQIRMTAAFRTFVGTEYASAIAGLSSFAEVSQATKETRLNLSKYMQRWYGTYKIPEDVHAVPAGYDVIGYLKKHGIDYKEDFWLTGGYIIVNFNILTYDSSGNVKLSYINADNYLNNGNCSMWVTEGIIPEKTDSNGNVFRFKAGDFIVYYTDKKYSDDYEGRLF